MTKFYSTKFSDISEGLFVMSFEFLNERVFVENSVLVLDGLLRVSIRTLFLVERGKSPKREKNF